MAARAEYNRRRRRPQVAAPLTLTTCPDIQELSGRHNRLTAAATSSDLPSHLNGLSSASIRVLSSVLDLKKESVSVGPGDTALIRVPHFASVWAIDRTIRFRAPFVEI